MIAGVAAVLVGVGSSWGIAPASAACELYPRFDPFAPRTSGEAWEADQFVDSVGVNLHLGSGKYLSEFYSKVRPWLLGLGVRKVRTGASALGTAPAHARDLGEAGIRMTLVTGRTTSVDSLIRNIKSVGPQYFFAVEGYNEPESRFDCSARDGCWVAPTRAFQQTLFNVIKADPATRDLLVMGPSLQTQNLDFSPAMLGSLDAFTTANNVHRYPGRYTNPEWRLFLPKLDNVLRHVGNPSEPTMMTETGYSTRSGGTLEAVEAVYMPRMFLRNFNHGLALTSKYELIDEGAASGNTDFEGNFGYIRTDNTPKPAYTAVRNLLQLLADPGSRFVPGTLAYGLAGNTADVARVLMQKRNGQYVLALWVALPIEKVVPQAVSLTLPASITTAAVVRPNDSTTWTPVPVTGGQVNLTVDARVLLVRLGDPGAARPVCASLVRR